MSPLRFIVLLWLAAGAFHGAWGHELRPAYLELREVAANTYDVLWKVPARDDRRLALYVVLPRHCHGSEPAARFIGGGYVERWTVTCVAALIGDTVSINGLEATRTDVLARFERVDGSAQTVRLTPAQNNFAVEAAPSMLQLARSYTALGIEHILLGVDHLLFVLGLIWIGRGPWRVVKTITAFTVAHSLTLAAATLGWVGVPEAPANAAIALSIVFVAVEMVKLERGEAGLSARMPWVMAFGFGLLHGFGFAGALTSLGLPPHEIPLALLFCNVGVELGQLGLALRWRGRFAPCRPGCRAGVNRYRPT